jgi:hypothetical protein
VAYLPTCVVASSRRLLWVKGGEPKQAAVSPDVRFSPKSGHRSGHSRRQPFANAAIAPSRVAA